MVSIKLNENKKSEECVLKPCPSLPRPKRYLFSDSVSEYVK